MLFDQSINDRVDGKLITAGMHAELKGIGEPEFADSEGNDTKVFVELLFELRKVAHVIDPFVEPSGELWGDRLDGYAFLGDHRQDQEQFHRVLRRVGLVDRDFSDKLIASFLFFDVPVDTTRLLYGEQEFAGGPAHGFLREVEGSFNTRNGERAGVAAHRLEESLDCLGLGWLPGEIRHV